MSKLAIRQLRDLFKNIKIWIMKNPLLFFLSLAAISTLIWIILETARRNNLGFADKSLWDWLDLFIVSAVITLGLFLLRQRENRRDEIRQEKDTENQLDNQRQIALLNYYDRMSKLILERHLSKSTQPAGTTDDTDAEAAVIARVITLAVVRELDPNRVEAVFRFLSDPELEGIISLKNGDLNNVNWSKINLSGTNLFFANLNEANLSHANLSDANLSYTNLRDANLSHANLRGANLNHTNLKGANLSHANLSGTKLDRANLKSANLSNAKRLKTDPLPKAYFRSATMPDGRKHEDWKASLPSEK